MVGAQEWSIREMSRPVRDAKHPLRTGEVQVRSGGMKKCKEPSDEERNAVTAAAHAIDEEEADARPRRRARTTVKAPF